MKHPAILLRPLALGATLLLVACHTPDADYSTLQDAKYPLDHQSKIGFPADDAIPSINARLASDDAKKQLRSLGFNVVPAEQADYIVNADELTRDSTTVQEPTGPSLATDVAGPTNGGGFFTGVGVGVPIGEPSTIIIHRTELDVSLETAQPPKLTVWQGKIVADADDAREYRAAFYRALLARVGTTTNGTLRLDRDNQVMPKP